jgi:hypothetical protein
MCVALNSEICGRLNRSQRAKKWSKRYRTLVHLPDSIVRSYTTNDDANSAPHSTSSTGTRTGSSRVRNQQHRQQQRRQQQRRKQQRHGRTPSLVGAAPVRWDCGLDHGQRWAEQFFPRFSPASYRLCGPLLSPTSLSNVQGSLHNAHGRLKRRVFLSSFICK